MGRRSFIPRSAILNPKDIINVMSKNWIPKFKRLLKALVGITSMVSPFAAGIPGIEGIMDPVLIEGAGILNRGKGFKLPVNSRIAIINAILIIVIPTERRVYPICFSVISLY
jgi:hypothetical protein